MYQKVSPTKCIRVHINNSLLKSNYILVFLQGDVWILFLCSVWRLIQNTRLPFTAGGTRWCSWLRYYATSRQVAVSIQSVVNSCEQGNYGLGHMKGWTTVSFWWTLLPREKTVVMILTILIKLTTIGFNTCTCL